MWGREAADQGRLRGVTADLELRCAGDRAGMREYERQAPKCHHRKK